MNSEVLQLPGMKVPMNSQEEALVQMWISLQEMKETSEWVLSNFPVLEVIINACPVWVEGYQERKMFFFSLVTILFHPDFLSFRTNPTRNDP